MVTSIVQGLLRIKITEGEYDGEYEGANAKLILLTDMNCIICDNANFNFHIILCT